MAIFGLPSDQSTQALKIKLQGYFDEIAAKEGTLTSEQQREESLLSTNISSGIINNETQLKTSFNIWKTSAPATKQTILTANQDTSTLINNVHNIFDSLIKSEGDEDTYNIKSEEDLLINLINSGEIKNTSEITDKYTAYISSGMQNTGTTSTETLRELLTSVQNGANLVLESIKSNFLAPTYAQKLVDDITGAVNNLNSGNITLLDAVQDAQDSAIKLASLNAMVKTSNNVNAGFAYYTNTGSNSSLTLGNGGNSSSTTTTKKRSILDIIGYDPISAYNNQSASITSSYDYLASQYQTSDSSSY